MSSKEKARVGQQRAELGEEGLVTKAQKLEEAIQQNEVGHTYSHTHTHHELNGISPYFFLSPIRPQFPVTLPAASQCQG